MIYKATELIKQEMDRQDMKYSVEEFDDRSIILQALVLTMDQA